MSAPRLPERWVGLYTRGLPLETREERRDEIACDVYEQCASTANADVRGVRAAVVGRTLRGVPGDVMWRFEEGRAMKQQRRELAERPVGLRAAWATVTQSWFTPLAVLVGIVDVAFAIWVVLDPDGKMPGQAIGPVVLVGFAAAMFTGLWLRWRARYGTDVPTSGASGPAKPRSAVLVLLAAISVVAIVVGGGVVGSSVLVLVAALVLVGVALVAMRRRKSAGAVPASVRTAPAPQSVVLADVLIVVGTLPALALFWFVVPAVLAIVVIGGVIGTGPKTRSEVAV